MQMTRGQAQFSNLFGHVCFSRSQNFLFFSWCTPSYFVVFWDFSNSSYFSTEHREYFLKKKKKKKCKCPAEMKNSSITFSFCLGYWSVAGLAVGFGQMFIFFFHSHPLCLLYKAHRAFIIHKLSLFLLPISVGLSHFSPTPLLFSS